MKKPWCVLCVALYLAVIAMVPARAAENVKIGVIYPLTGNAASAGQSAKDAVSGAPRSSSTRRIIKAIRRWASSKPCA